MDELTPAERNALKDLIEKYKDTIDKMPEALFTSHQFILELAQKNQRLYVGALNRYIDNDSPFRTLHSRLAIALKDFPQLVSRIAEDVPSEDIFRRSRTCAAWKKVSTDSTTE